MNADVILLIQCCHFRKWNKVESLSVVTDPVHDVAFAPNLGRSHHLLAIASKDLKIISLTPLGYVYGKQLIVMHLVDHYL